jgi:MbtH protein
MIKRAARGAAFVTGPVVDNEAQHSMWLASRVLPLGWWEAGTQGSKSESLAFVVEVWHRPADS